MGSIKTSIIFSRIILFVLVIYILFVQHGLHERAIKMYKQIIINKNRANYTLFWYLHEVVCCEHSDMRFI